MVQGGSYLTAPDAPDVVWANFLLRIAVIAPPASRQVEQFILVKSERESLWKPRVVIATSLAPNSTDSLLNIWRVQIRGTK